MKNLRITRLCWITVRQLPTIIVRAIEQDDRLKEIAGLEKQMKELAEKVETLRGGSI